MLRIIVIAVLSVLVVVETGCDKIRTELERRHLASETYKETAFAASQAVKAFHVKHDNVETISERKQIVIRIDLPTDEKIQIRLIKNAVPEEASKYVDVSSKETVKGESLPNDEAPRDKSEFSTEPEKKSQPERIEKKDEEPKSEIKSELDQEPKSEMKTYHEETLEPPASAPTVIVPADKTTSPSVLPDDQVKKSLTRPELSEMAPAEKAAAEKAVGLALDATLPETNSESNKPLNTVPAANKPSVNNPWAIPDADYPLRYY